LRRGRSHSADYLIVSFGDLQPFFTKRLVSLAELMSTSEKTKASAKCPKPKKPSHRDRIFRMKSNSFPTDYHEENAVVQVVYLARSPCLQTFHSQWTRYFNLVVRPFEAFYPFSHWSLVITPQLADGQPSRVSYEWPSRRTELELEAVSPDRDRNTPTVGSFDKCSPIRNRPFSRLLYLGTTTLSDSEITTIAKLITDYLKNEGTYHGIFRNCQHWIHMVTSIICPDAKLPLRVDQTGLAIFYLFKHSNRNMKERIEKAQAYYRQRLEESQNEK